MTNPAMNRTQNAYHRHGQNSSIAPLSSVAEKYDGVAMMMSAAAATSSSSAGDPTMMKHTTQSSFADNDAPLVTPTVTTRMMTFSNAFLRKNLPTPPWTDDIIAEGQSASSLISPSSSTSPSSCAPQNPLDLLSTVSSQLADKDNINNITKTQYQQQINTCPYNGQRNSLNQRHGRGTMTYPNGCHYSGCFTNDKRHGFGVCHYPNGCIYNGFWTNGKRDGVGKMIYADRGDIYEGEWMDDRRHGRGIYYRIDGRADVCRYVDHDCVGEGTQWSPNRSFVVVLMNGVAIVRVGVGEALEICERVGVPGVPRQVFPEFQFDGKAGVEG